jgi:hypothetical protein
MMTEFGMRNEEFGIPDRPPRALEMGGWVAFLIPNSYVLIRWVVGWT